MAKQILIEDAFGETQEVSEKAFELIYQPKGYIRISPTDEDEIETDIDESDVENTGKASDAGPSGAAVGSRARKSNKAKNS